MVSEILDNSELFLTSPRNSSGGRQITLLMLKAIFADSLKWRFWVQVTGRKPDIRNSDPSMPCFFILYRSIPFHKLFETTVKTIIFVWKQCWRAFGWTTIPVLLSCWIRDWILLVCFSWRYEVTEGPRVNFVMREALFEIYTWILCRFIPPWETNK